MKIDEMNKVNGAGISTTDASGSTGWVQTDTWCLFKKNNTTNVDTDGNPDGHTDYNGDWHLKE